MQNFLSILYLAERELMAKNWYVLHSFTGHENKIEKTIRKMMDDEDFAAVVSDVKVPAEKVLDAKRKERLQKVLPGYIFLEMDLPESGWQHYTSQIYRLQGVSGFVGTKSNSKPQAISTEETKNLLARIGEIKGDSNFKFRQNYVEGETVRIIDGPFESFTGKIEEVHNEKNRLKITVGIFGRNTPVEVEFRQVEKV